MENLDSDVVFTLGHALYHLYHTHDLDSADFFHMIRERLRSGSSGQDIEHSIKALEWAMEHKDYNFTEILPNIKFSNDYILRFIDKYLNMLKSSFDEETIDAMRIPLDERRLKILLVDNWQTGDVVIKLTGTTYDTAIAHDIESAITKYLTGNFEVVILGLNKSPNDNLIFLAKFREIKEQTGHNQVPVLVLINIENNISIEKLYELGCNKHLFLPVPRYLLLQEIYRLTNQT
jgi:PleD family two-component response regulator